ncbi:hypothetical protein [Nocardiopsis sp. CA-288880]
MTAVFVHGARTARSDGLGHWWMPQDPAAEAEATCSFCPFHDS